MKKYIIASVVGALIIFIWQFLSYGLLNFHEPAQQYTDKQSTILDFLASQDLKEGGYYLPNVSPGTSFSEYDAQMASFEGKPWAIIQYHDALDTGMGMNMARGFLVNIIIVFLFCWMMGKMQSLNFKKVFLSALAVGIIVFLNSYYTGYIWYKTFDIWASLADAIVAWGLTGVWLGWYLNRGKRETIDERKEVRSYEMAS